jgi:hypothetical protein
MAPVSATHNPHTTATRGLPLLSLLSLLVTCSVATVSTAADSGVVCHSLTGQNGFSQLSLEISEQLGESSVFKYGGPPSQVHGAVPPSSSAPTDWVYASSEGQDKMVQKLLQNKTNGFFVDLAARFWMQKSNSFTLEYYYNWSGACIEPDLKFYPSIAANRKCSVFCNNIIGAKNYQKYIFQYKKPLLLVHASASGPDVKVSVTLNKILDYMRAPSQIDYMSLDCEGCEESAIRSINSSKYSIQVISIERPTKVLHRLLSARGFWFLTHMSGGFGETMYVHSSIVNFNNHMNEYRPHAEPHWQGRWHFYLLWPQWPGDKVHNQAAPSGAAIASTEQIMPINMKFRPRNEKVVGKRRPQKIMSTDNRARKRKPNNRGIVPAIISTNYTY